MTDTAVAMVPMADTADGEAGPVPGGRQRSGALKRFMAGPVGINLTRLAIVAAFVGFWQYMVSSERIDPFFYGEPSQVWNYLWEMVDTGLLWPNLRATLIATLLGFSIGSVLGISVGFALGISPYLDKLFSPFVSGINAMPRIALAPLFIIWFGLTSWAKVWLAVSIVFFILLVNTRAGVRTVDPDHVVIARMLDMPRWRYFSQVLLPTAVPPLMAGLHLAVIYSLLGVIASEMIAAREGLGLLAIRASASFNVGGVMAILVVIAAMAMTINFFLGRLEKRFERWR